MAEKTSEIEVYYYRANSILPSLAGETAICDRFERPRIFGDSGLSCGPLLHVADAD